MLAWRTPVTRRRSESIRPGFTDSDPGKKGFQNRTYFGPRIIFRLKKNGSLQNNKDKLSNVHRSEAIYTLKGNRQTDKQTERRTNSK